MGTKDVVEKVWSQNGGHRNTGRMKESMKTFLVLASFELKCAYSCNSTYDYYKKGKNVPNIGVWNCLHFVPKNKMFLSILLRTVIAAESLIL